jgi:hypothetical protein
VSDMPRRPEQLPLCFDNSAFPSSEAGDEFVVKSNVIKVGFGVRIFHALNRPLKSVDEQEILNDVVLEAKKLRW